jgi:hypothetical protein
MQEDVQDAEGAERGASHAHNPLTRGLSERFVELGRAAGFDMCSLAGVAAWSIEYKRRVMAGEPLEVTLPQADHGRAIQARGPVTK